MKTRILNLNNLCYGTRGGNDTEDYVFSLSLDELIKYFGDSGQLRFNNEKGYFSDQYDNARIAYDASGATWFWILRSLGIGSYNAAFVPLCG